MEFLKPLICANLLHSQNQAEKSTQFLRLDIPYGKGMTPSPGAASGAMKKHPEQRDWAPASGSEALDPGPTCPLHWSSYFGPTVVSQVRKGQVNLT